MMLSAEDRLALHELLARYTHALDYDNIEAMTDIWTPDCEFRADEPPVAIRGVEELMDFFRTTVKAVPNVRHVVSNVFVDGGGDRAELRAYVQITDFTEARIIAAGRYRDTVLRTERGWRIHQRQFSAG